MILAGTGHRPNKLGGYGEEVHRKLISLARYAIKTYEPSQIISGGALGWDTALAAAARMEQVPYTLAIPFEGQELKWPKTSQERYRIMRSLAANVIIVSSGGYSAEKMQIRNQWMVDNAGGVLALWDGSAGGTSNCVQYALKQQRPIYNLWSKWIQA